MDRDLVATLDDLLSLDGEARQYLDQAGEMLRELVVGQVGLVAETEWKDSMAA